MQTVIDTQGFGHNSELDTRLEFDSVSHSISAENLFQTYFRRLKLSGLKILRSASCFLLTFFCLWLVLVLRREP